MKKTTLAVAVRLLPCMFLTSSWVRAQDEAPKPTLEQRLRALEKAKALERADFEFEVESLHDEIDELKARQQPAQGANAFNPQITVFGNLLARSDSRQVFLDNDASAERLDDRIQFRELEIDFRGAIDPFADAVVITTIESEVPGEFDAGIEEAYVDLKGLPFVESAPLGLKLRLGRFRPEFGRLNQVHLHDLPQPTYPHALGALLGPEGYVQEGLAARFFLPTPGDGQSIEANLQLLSGGGLPIADSQSGSNLAFLGHLKLFQELGTSSTVDLGTSLWQSDSDHVLYGLDAMYKWKPLLQGESRSFLLGGEIFRADLKDPATSNSPGGYYLWSQYQLRRNLYLGARFDQSESLQDSDLETKTIGFWGTYYTSEFLRLRLGYERTSSDIALLDELGSLFVELNFIFGSHPAEPYWVSR